MSARDSGGLFMHEKEIEANCGFFGGHCFSANQGVQKCLWCTATRQAPADVQTPESSQ